MKVLQHLRNALGLETRSPLDNPSISLNAPAAWGWLAGANASDSGELINATTAMQVSTVAICVKILSESIASLPLVIYQRSNNGRAVAYSHSLYHLLAGAPNDEMTAFSFWECIVTSLCLLGNAYAQIQRDGAGNCIALWPLNAQLTVPIRISDGTLAYRTTDASQEPRILASRDVLHFLMTSHDGVVGLSPIQQARQSIGLARAAERYGSYLFRNNATPSLVIKTDAKVTAETKTLMRQEWEALQSGSNQHRIAVLDQGVTITPLSITPDDAQFLQTRNYQRADIAAMFRIAPHLVGSTERITNSNLEQENLSFVTQTLRPWLSRLEAEIRRKLLPQGSGQATYEVEFDTSELRRGDSAAQAAALTAGRNGGWLSANECRHQLNLNPGPASLDAYLVPVNYQASERLLDPPAGQKEVKQHEQ